MSDLIAKFEDEWQSYGREWAYDNDWATIKQIKRADELFPKVIEQLDKNGTLQDMFCRKVYDYCFVKEETAVADIVQELEAQA